MAEEANMNAQLRFFVDDLTVMPDEPLPTGNDFAIVTR
jgi:hypothetical protein